MPSWGLGFGSLLFRCLPAPQPGIASVRALIRAGTPYAPLRRPCGWSAPHVFRPGTGRWRNAVQRLRGLSCWETVTHLRRHPCAYPGWRYRDSLVRRTREGLRQRLSRLGPLLALAVELAEAMQGFAVTGQRGGFLQGGGLVQLAGCGPGIGEKSKILGTSLRRPGRVPALSNYFAPVRQFDSVGTTAPTALAGGNPGTASASRFSWKSFRGVEPVS